MTFADAASEWLRFIEEDRERKPSTVRDYRSVLNAHLLPAFGDRPIEAVTTEEIERWRRSLTDLSNRSKNKLLIQLHGIFRRAQTVWALPVNPCGDSGWRLAVKRCALGPAGRPWGDSGAGHPLGGGEVEQGARWVGDGDGDVLL